ncbi:MAG: hypothetical protein V2J13_11075, partial [Cycloclasticus sp.]|nr:hypothetical protein [Cycloclasticus sp.]
MITSDPHPSRRRKGASHRAHWYDRVPLMVLTSGIGALLMVIPAVYAGMTGDHATGRPFLYGALLFTVLTGLVALSTATRPVDHAARGLLLS